MAIPKTRENAFKERFEEYTRTLDCIHCGLCIPYCPTQGVSGRESDSPRGRIYLMRGFAEESTPFTRESLRHLDQCIVCRHCETVCPSGIRMGDMMESFRHEMQQRLPRKSWRNHLGRLLLTQLMPHRQRIAWLSDLLYAYDRWGVRRVTRAVLGRFSSRFARLDRLMPPVPPPRERRIATDAKLPGGFYPAVGKARMRVALFLGCITSELFAPTHRATIRVLNRAGCDVYVPDAQTCCGALHRHGGFLPEAQRLYERNARAFGDAPIDVVAVNAAGCGAALKEPPASCPDGLGVPVRDICELLQEIGIAPPDRELACKVVYDQPCHLVHGQRVPATAVTELLEQIPGLRLLPLRDSDRCCGSGGIYNLVHAEMADPILDDKVEAILESGAEVVVTGNPGCWMQIRYGLLEHPVQVLHPIDLLDRAYSDKPPVTAAGA